MPLTARGGSIAAAAVGAKKSISDRSSPTGAVNDSRASVTAPSSGTSCVPNIGAGPADVDGGVASHETQANASSVATHDDDGLPSKILPGVSASEDGVPLFLPARRGDVNNHWVPAAVAGSECGKEDAVVSRLASPASLPASAQEQGQAAEPSISDSPRLSMWT